MNSDANGAPTRSARRRFGYLLIAVALPFLLLGSVELALRLAGIGDYPPLFVPAAGADGYLQPNEAAMTRFFAHPAQAPDVSIDTTYFREKRAAGSLRIVVQGGSSAAGFPYGKWASPAGMLKRRLRASYPEREIEVISTAMSAVNSFSLLDFADEIVAIAPDAVIIYAGHNEYLGVLGVGSAYSSSRSPALTRLILTLRRLHLYRALETLLARAPAEKPTGTLMARIAGERAIPFGSELYERGVVQFRDNLSRLLRRYRAAGIPVYVGTLASNERDQPPFVSAPAEDGERSADHWFARGQQSLASERYQEAAKAFSTARDLDQLRFRAPGAFNDVVREQAGTHAATLVDVRAALAQESEAGIVGKEVMLEHLHPNTRGYFLLADAYFDAIIDSELAGEPERAIADDAAWRTQPVTRIDELAAGYRLERLLADWPFQETRQTVSLPPANTPEEQIAQAWYTGRLSWPDAMNRALVYYQQQNDLDSAVRVALNLAEAFHFLGNIQYIAGQLLVKRGDARMAVHYLERSVALQPVAAHYLGLAEAYQRLGRGEEAAQAAREVLRRDPGNRAATAVLNAVTPGDG